MDKRDFQPAEAPGPRTPRHARARLLLAAAAGGAAALLAVPLLPAVGHELGPAEVSAGGGLDPGRTVLAIPPLGTVSADTHASILSAELSLRSVDFASLLDSSSTRLGRRALVRDIERDLRALSVKLALQLVAGALVVGAITGALLFHRRLRETVAGAIGGAIVVGATLGTGAATFDPDAFREPQFEGALVDAPEVIDTVTRGLGAVEELRSRYSVATTRLSRLLVLMAQPDVDPRSGSTAILHVGDIHSNPIGVEITRQLAQEFDVDAVLDTGDIGSFGEPIEARITRLVDDIREPYLFVPGNHDSSLLIRAMSRVDNVTVLDQETVDVGRVTILGWGDPLFTEAHRFSFREGLELKAKEAEVVASATRRTQPDVLAVHDKRIAEGSFGSVPLVLSGHYHKGAFEEVDGTRIMEVGSTGATGLQSFTLEADMFYEAQIVYFRGGRPMAVDYVRFRGLGSDFGIERTTLEPVEAPAQDDAAAMVTDVPAGVAQSLEAGHKDLGGRKSGR